MGCTSSFLHTNTFSDTNTSMNSNTNTFKFISKHGTIYSIHLKNQYTNLPYLQCKLTNATHCHLLALRLCTRLLAAYENDQDHHHHHPQKNIIILLMYADDDEDEEEDFCKFNSIQIQIHSNSYLSMVQYTVYT